MNKKTTFSSNWPKWALQWSVLASLLFFLSGLAARIFPKMEAADPERLCPMGGIEAFVTYLTRGSLPCSMSSTQIMMGLGLALAVILFSKLFCAYLCPVGSVEDLLMKCRDALKIKPVEIRQGSVVDKLLRIAKYALLFWIFYMTATASELFCKKLDPYYAVATGFKGEITLWMSVVTVSVVLLLGIVIKRFWCRYICPLGAASNSFKFWIPMSALVALWWVASRFVDMPWWVLLAAWCVAGWALEAFYAKPKFQILNVIRDEEKCTHSCRNCQKHCPYNVDVPSYGKRVTSVDCTLCGECVAACPLKALRIGTCTGSKPETAAKAWRFIPGIITILVALAAMYAGSRFELPTIDETWGVEDGMKLETLRVEGLKTVKCYGSSMAFKAKMENTRGVHGVKTYVGSHTVVIKYDPKRTSEEMLKEQIFEPSHFRVNSPDPKAYDHLKVVTIRTEKMTSKVDLNMLGLQFRVSGKKIFGLESEYACPLIVRVYMDPDENLDEAWFREQVNKKELVMPIHGGNTKTTDVDFEFVRLEKGESKIGIAEYLTDMLDTFKADYYGEYPSADTTVIRKRSEVYADKPQFVYEITDQNFEKPIVMRGLPFLSNHLSRNEGVISMYMQLNKDLLPSIQVRFAEPMTADKVWELMTMDTWTITYKKDEDVREEPARLRFNNPGIVYPYEGE